MSDVVAQAIVEIVAETQDFERQLRNIASKFTGPQQQQLSRRLSEPFQSASTAAQRMGQDGEKALAKVSQAATRTGKSLKGLFGGASAALAGITATAAVTGSNFNVLQQQVRASLTAIKGLEEGEKILANVNKLVDDSPFARPVFLQATQQLAAFGVESEKIVPVLDAIQQAVAGFGGSEADIPEFANVFAQIQSLGRITGEEVQRFSSRGVDVLEILAKQAGITAEQMQKRISDGAVGATEAIDGLVDGIQEKFGGATANVRKTFVGALDRVKAAFRDIGAQSISGLIDPKSGGLLVDSFNNIATAMRKVQAVLVPVLQPAFAKLGIILASVTKNVADFAATLSKGDVSDFVGQIAKIAPLLAAIGGGFVTSFAANIPILQQFGFALSPITTGIVLFAAAIPEVRQAIAGMAETLKPLIDQVLPKFLVLFGAVQELIAKVSESFIQQLTPILAGFLNVLNAILPALTVFALALSKIAPLLSSFLILITINTLLKATGAGMARLSNSILNIGSNATGAGGALSKLGVGTKAIEGGTLAAAGGVAKLSAGFTKAIPVIGLALTAFTVFKSFQKPVETLEQKIAKLGDTAKATSADLQNLFKPEQLEAVNNSLDDLEKKTVSLRNEANKQGQQGGFVSSRDLFNIKEAAKNVQNYEKNVAKAGEVIRAAAKAGFIAQAEETVKTFGNIEARNQLLAIIKEEVLLKQREALVTELNTAKAGGNAEAIDKATAAILAFDEANKAYINTAGLVGAKLSGFALIASKLQGFLDGTNVSLNKGVTVMKLNQEALDNFATKLDAVKSAQDAVKNAQQGLTDAQDRAKDSRENLTQATKAAADIDVRLADTLTQLNTLTEKRQALLNDTASDTRELVEAEENLLQVGFQLRDLEQEKIATEEKIQEIRDSQPQDLADIDENITRAKIALNKATRDEQKLLKGTNKAKINLKGLSLDELKIKLADIRASQQAENAGPDPDEEIEKEEALTLATLDKGDAQQRVQELELSKNELIKKDKIEIREAEERLLSISLEREGALRAETDAQDALNKIRAGDTQRTRDIKDLDEEIKDINVTIKGLREDQAAAAIKIKDANDAIVKSNDLIKISQEAITTAKQAAQKAQATLVGDESKLNELLITRIGLQKELVAGNAAAARVFIEAVTGSKLPEGLSAEILSKISTALIDSPGNLPAATIVKALTGKDLPSVLSPEFIQRIANALLKAPGTPFQDIFKQLKVPGFFADGGIVSAPGKYGLLAHVGEYNRPEMIGPLTNPSRFMSVLQQAMPYAHPQIQQMMAPALGSSPDTITNPTISRSQIGETRYAPSVSRSSAQAEMMQAAQQKELISTLKEISHKLDTLDPTTTNNVEIKVDGSGNPEIAARRVARQVEKILKKPY